MKKYVTVSGDTFDIIAKKILGDEMLAEQIMSANLHLIDYIVFPANVEVNIPEVTIETKSNNLPPWRKSL